ncbi:hypothetical protein BJ165DRAFT_1042046 [Panaeolus papilionaceus]|nr:hypothetical protein BJ165DRAFT_1042046 [Panaeolus papilionaceus]
MSYNSQDYSAPHDAGANPYFYQRESDGPHQPNGQHAVMNHDKPHGDNKSLTPAILRAFAYNERVSVNIEGRGWLVGTVLSFANMLGAFTGSSIVVRYNPGRGPVSQPFPNDDSHIRRYPTSYSDRGGY